MTGFGAIVVAEDGGSDGQHWAGQSRILGPKWARLPVLTAGMAGLQVFWSVEMSYASPYLLSLGVSKSHMALVFVAGPLSGLLVQPLIGSLADSSKSKYGRRRPYMLIGTGLCVLAMLLLGYTRGFASLFSAAHSSFNDSLTIWLAVLAIYAMDFAVNAVMAVDRALVVDSLPAADQAQGNAWLAIMSGIGGVLGFFFGNFDLTGILGWIGETQLKILTVVASFLLTATHLTTAFMVKEKILVASSKSAKGFKAEMLDIWRNMRKLPPVIKQICYIQFFAWIGWFPILFYTTTYIGELYKRAAAEPENDAAAALLDADATRSGTRGLFYSSLLSLATNLIAPYLVVSDKTPESRSGASTLNGNGFYEHKKSGVMKRMLGYKIHLATIWAASHAIFAACMGATFFITSAWAATIAISITGISWGITMWAPFTLIGEAILAPGSDVDDAGSIRLHDARRSDADEQAQFLVASDSEDEDEVEGRPHRPRHSRRNTPDNILALGMLGNSAARQSSVNIADLGRGGDDDDQDQGVASPRGSDLAGKAGIILGIHNVFIVIPQFLVTGLSSIIFAIFEPDKSVLHGSHPGKTIPPGNGTVPAGGVGAVSNASVDAIQLLASRGLDFVQNADSLRFGRREETEAGVNSVAIIFRVGGFAAMIACALTWRLARELKKT